MTYGGTSRLGDYFASRREKGHPGIPMLSVTLNNGLVNRDCMERKQETTLSADQHLLVKPGDIAYNMMRMWQGASGMSEQTGMVSPAYVVLRPRGGIDPKYASYLFKSKRLIYLFWAYSYGLTDDRLRLYYPDFSKIPVSLPSIVEQKRRAAAIAGVEILIDVQKKLLGNSLAMKAAILQRSLRPRFDQIKAGWTEIEFGELVDRVRKQFDPSTADVPSRCCIELEHVGQGTGTLVGSITTTTAASMKLEFQPSDVLFGKLRPYLRKYWLADRVGVCSSEFWVLRVRNAGCTAEFLKCILESEPFMRAVFASAGSKMPRAEWDYVSQTSILMPPQSDQERLVSMMNGCDEEVQTRRRYIAALENERNGLVERFCTPREIIHPVLESA